MHIRWRIAQFFELHWWRRYLSGREKAAYLAWKRAYWRQLLAENALKPPPGSTVLDAGCGPAGIFLVLEQCRVDAVDPLLAAYEAALLHFSRADYPAVDFYDAPLEHFSPAKQYDYVFCLNALNHVADLPLCLGQLAGLTRPGGRLVLTVDAHRRRWLRRLFQIFPGDILHPQQFTVAEYRGMLQAEGYWILHEKVLKKTPVFHYVLFVAERRRDKCL